MVYSEGYPWGKWVAKPHKLSQLRGGGGARCGSRPEERRRIVPAMPAPPRTLEMSPEEMEERACGNLDLEGMVGVGPLMVARHGARAKR